MQHKLMKLESAFALAIGCLLAVQTPCLAGNTKPLIGDFDSTMFGRKQRYRIETKKITPSPFLSAPKAISDHLSRQDYFKAFNEKPLLKNAKQDKVFRFLWLRSFHHPICITIYFSDDAKNGSVLVAKELDGANVYGKPIGKLIRNKSWKLSPKLTKSLEKRITDSGFWNEHSTAIYEGFPKGKEIKIVDDGAQWTVEGWNHGRYHIVNRTSPRTGSTWTIGVTLLKLAKLYPDNENEVY